MNQNPEVLIVGAGPTGLTLACHLLRLGIRVRIVDKKAGRSTTSKAIGLQYRVSEILACMGIADRFLARGGSPTAVNIHLGKRRLVRLRLEVSGAHRAREAFAPGAIMIPQSETEEILGDLLRERGGRVEWNTELSGFEQDANRVISRLKNAGGEIEDVCSPWLVSCEGAHSVIRQQAGIALTGKTYPLEFFLADVELSGPLRHGENYVWLHRDGSFAALPFARPGSWRLIVDITKGNGKQADVTLETINALMIDRTGARDIVISNPSWISDFRIHCRMVDRYRSGRVFVAGDAAHIHSPTGGQGIVTGMQDATNLAWKLARALRGAPEALLDTYEEERLPKAREVLQETDRTTRVLVAPTFTTRLLRDLLLLPMMRMDWVQKKMFSKLAQLHVNYRDSSLSRDEPTGSSGLRSRLKAGDRAPDICFRREPSGEKVTLFKLLEPMQPIALLGAAIADRDASMCERLQSTLAEANVAAFLVTEENPVHDAECLIDLYGDFRRLYGMTGQFVCLIRPDDYIGLFQDPPNEQSLSQYLSQISRDNFSFVNR